MQDRPNAVILLEAIQDFLIKEALPALKENDALSYKALVSWNMLGVITREWKLGEQFVDSEIERISTFLKNKAFSFSSVETREKNYFEKLEYCRELNEKLTEYIQKKQVSIEDKEVWELVKQTVKEKLEISNPRFSVED